MVDLITAKVGDKVTLRSGYQNTIAAIRRNSPLSFSLWFENYGGSVNYVKMGNMVSKNHQTPFDIVELIPVHTPFDFSKAKWGMAFENVDMEIFYFVGFGPDSKRPIFDIIGTATNHATWIRCPSFDIVKNEGK